MPKSKVRPIHPSVELIAEQLASCRTAAVASTCEHFKVHPDAAEQMLKLYFLHFSFPDMAKGLNIHLQVPIPQRTPEELQALLPLAAGVLSRRRGVQAIHVQNGLYFDSLVFGLCWAIDSGHGPGMEERLMSLVIASRCRGRAAAHYSVAARSVSTAKDRQIAKTERAHEQHDAIKRALPRLLHRIDRWQSKSAEQLEQKLRSSRELPRLGKIGSRPLRKLIVEEKRRTKATQPST